MAVTVQCANPNCGKASLAAEKVLGRNVRCKSCGQSFVATAIMDGQASKPQPAEATPTMKSVGRFQVRERLGAGAFGTVYRAYDPQLDREVAIKVPNPGALADPKRVERFLREARAAAKLRHPHIVPVFDTGKDGESLYIASAFIQGQPLSHTIEEHGVDFRRAARIVRELSEALAYAHEQGIVHRDVKPDNMLVDRQDRVHLTDFGLAVQHDDESRLTKDGAVMGTPSYMAPEQARGKSGEAGPAADQYSAGVVLYELLTGALPFEGPIAVVLHNVVHTPPEPPSNGRGNVPKDIETICLKAMAKRPEDRYASCQDLADDLRRWQEGEPITARRMSVVERVSRWARKNPAAATAGGLAVAIFGLCGFALVLWGMYTAEQRQRGAAEQATAAAQLAESAAIEERANTEAARVEAVNQRARAESERASAETARAEAEKARNELAASRELLARIEYGRTIQVAHLAWRDTNVEAAQSLLAGTRPDLRGWEWRYVHRLCNSHQFEIKEIASSAMFSPDGSQFVTAMQGVANVWDGRTGAKLLTLQGHVRWKEVYKATYSPDGSRIITASEDNTAKIWNSRTGAEILTLKGHTAAVFCATFSSNGSRIVTSSQDGTAKVWDAKSGAILHTLSAHAVNVAVRSAVFSSDGSRIVTASFDKTVKIWNAKDGTQIRTLRGHTESVWSAVFSPDGSRIMTASSDKTAKTWDANNGTEIHTFVGHTGGVASAVFSPDGSQIVTASYDKTARVWDANTGAHLYSLIGHPGWVTSVDFSPDGKRIITASWDMVFGRTRVWEANSAESLIFKDRAYFPQSFSPDGSRIAAPSGDKTAKVWDAKTGAQLQTLTGHGDRILSAVFSPDGSRIVTTSADKSAKVWDARTGDQLHTLMRHDDQVVSAVFSPDGSRIATASSDKTAKIWDATNGAEILTLKGHTDKLRMVSYTPDGSRIVTASANEAIIWDAISGVEILTIKDFGGYRTALHSPGSLRIITGSVDNTAKVWDTKSGAEILELQSQVTSASYSPDESRIVTVSHNTAKVWDAKSGAEILTLKGHTDSIGSAWYSPDGSRIVTAGGFYERTAKIWDATSGAELLTLNDCLWAAFSKDGTQIVAAGWDGILRILDSQPVNLAFLAKDGSLLAPKAQR